MSPRLVLRPVATWLAILALAAGLRLLPVERVLGGSEVDLLVDTDPHYHVLRAHRTLATFPTPPWWDPRLNHPVGAEIFWPPLFDELIAATAVAVHGTGASREEVARVAAVIPVALGVWTVLLIGALHVLVLKRPGWLAGLIAAVVPSAVYFTVIGRPDQHCLELLLWCAALLGYFLAWSEARVSWAGTLLLGGALTLAFWNWTGSGLYLGALALHAAIEHFVAPAGRRPAGTVAAALAISCGFAALCLALSIWRWGSAGALGQFGVHGIGGLAVLLNLLVAAFAAVLAGVSRFRPATPGVVGRAFELGLAAALPLAVIGWVAPGARTGAAQGLAGLAATGSWYANIDEFRPALLSGIDPLSHELARLAVFYGFFPLLMLGATWMLARAWGRQPQARQSFLLVLVLAALFTVLALARIRFMLYLVLPLSLVGAWGLQEAAEWAAARTRTSRARVVRAGVMMGGVLLGVGPAARLDAAFAPESGVDPALQAVARWLERQPHEATEGIMASWKHGHGLLYLADMPVVASPFGTEGGVGAMTDSAAFYFASSPERAEAVLARRGTTYVVLDNPRIDLLSLQDFAPPGTVLPFRDERSYWRGRNFDPADGFWELVVARLYWGDGVGRSGAREPMLGGFRLLFETVPTSLSEPFNDQRYKVFGVVRGARVLVRQAVPGAWVSASIQLTTNIGRSVVLETTSQADAQGHATLRLPYSLGANGAVRASAWRLTDGQHQAELGPGEAQVVGGTALEVELR